MDWYYSVGLRVVLPVAKLLGRVKWIRRPLHWGIGLLSSEYPKSLEGDWFSLYDWKGREDVGTQTEVMSICQLGQSIWGDTSEENKQYPTRFEYRIEGRICNGGYIIGINKSKTRHYIGAFILQYKSQPFEHLLGRWLGTDDDGLITGRWCLRRDQMPSASSLAETRKSVPVMTRSYVREVQQVVNSLPGWQSETIGSETFNNEQLPVLSLQTSKKDNQETKVTVVVAGGVHGYEVAGTYACLELARTWNQSPISHVRVIVLPCVNPSGFVLNTLEDHAGNNLNRHFGKASGSPLNRIVETYLDKLQREGTKIDLFVDCHEIDPNWADEGFRPRDNPQSCYLYEVQEDRSKRIGHRVIGRLPQGTQVCTWERIYNDKNDRGVVAYPQEGEGNATYSQGTTLDSYVANRYSIPAITLETPLVWTVEQRVTVQLSMIRACMTELLALKNGA